MSEAEIIPSNYNYFLFTNIQLFKHIYLRLIKKHKKIERKNLIKLEKKLLFDLMTLNLFEIKNESR